MAGSAVSVSTLAISEPADPADPLLGYRDGNVILMPHTAIGAGENALLDLERLCTNVWRAVTDRPAPRDQPRTG